MQTLKTMTEDGAPGFERITKNFLHSSEFRQLNGLPRQQALVLEIYARYKTWGKKHTCARIKSILYNVPQMYIVGTP